jgi:hypothetical protein
VALVGGYLGGRQVLQRRRVSRLRARITGGKPGETASLPLAIDNAAAAPAAAAQVACTCGGRLSTPPPAPLDVLRLGDDTILCGRFACDRCAQARAVYFRPRA